LLVCVSAAKSLAAAELPGQQRQQAYQAIASSWAQTDPQAAMAWANTLTGGNDKRNAVSSILSTWAQSDVTSAMAYAKQLPEGSAKNQALSSISQQWAQQDPKAAMDVETVEQWNVRCRMPQLSSRSIRTVAVSHVLPLLQFLTDQPSNEWLRVASLTNPYRAPNPWAHESGSAVPS